MKLAIAIALATISTVSFATDFFECRVLDSKQQIISVIVQKLSGEGVTEINDTSVDSLKFTGRVNQYYINDIPRAQLVVSVTDLINQTTSSASTMNPEKGIQISYNTVEDMFYYYCVVSHE